MDNQIKIKTDNLNPDQVQALREFHKNLGSSDIGTKMQPINNGGFLIPNEPYRVELRGFARFKAWIMRRPLYVMRPGISDQIMAMAKNGTSS